MTTMTMAMAMTCERLNCGDHDQGDQEGDCEHNVDDGVDDHV